jgi:small subunit ribosomal protein S9
MDETLTTDQENAVSDMQPRKELKDGEYIEAIGRRKTAGARVRIVLGGKNTYNVNGNSLATHFQTTSLQDTAKDALVKSDLDVKFNVSVHVKGGGVQSQAEAMRHGLARALVEFDPSLRKLLKKLGYLKRDPRKKERKKFGLKKARRAPQWSKR